MDFSLLIAALSSAEVDFNSEVVHALFKAFVSKLANTRINSELKHATFLSHRR